MKILKFLIITLLIGSIIFLISSCSDDETNMKPNQNFKGRWVGTYETDGTSFFGLELNADGELIVFASDNYYSGTGTWSKDGKSFKGTYEYTDFPGTWNLSAELVIEGTDTTMTGTWTDGSDSDNTGSFSVEKNIAYPASALTYEEDASWTCAGNNCQTVWEVFLVKGMTTVSISDLTGGSIGQIALYAPGTNLGGTNLLTGDMNELQDCTQTGNCDNGAPGVSKSISVTATGVYKFVATRNNNESCSSTGNFTATISTEFPVTANSVASNVASQAAGVTCK